MKGQKMNISRKKYGTLFAVLLCVVCAFAFMPMDLPAAPAAGLPYVGPQTKPGEVMEKEQARAAADAGNVYKAKPPGTPFDAGIFYVGAFATARVRHFETLEQIADDHQAGGGLEFGYSFTRNLTASFRLHAQAQQITDDFLNEGAIGLSYGIPIGPFKPYALVLAGYEIIHKNLALNSSYGGGVEFALSKRYRLFAEGQKYATGRDEGYVAYLGLRFSAY
jgi:hypothetical protein